MDNFLGYQGGQNALAPTPQPNMNALYNPGLAAILPDQSNFNAAHAAMNLTPQEQNLYRMHLSNLTGFGGVDNPDGSRSTLYQMGVGIGDKTYNLPTVWGGKILPPEDAFQRAKAAGLQNFPSYGSQEEAEQRYQQMHDFMEKDTGSYLRARGY